jgi:hypothetical protein
VWVSRLREGGRGFVEGRTMIGLEAGPRARILKSEFSSIPARYGHQISGAGYRRIITAGMLGVGNGPKGWQIPIP